jgi:DNA-binding MarR family transcriptional regulator
MQNGGAVTGEREPASPSERVTAALTGLELALIRHRNGVRRRLAVSEEELAVLLCLGHEGRASQSRLAALSTLSRSGIGALLQRLESEGLVERRTQPGDRRVRLVRLSARGQARLRDAYRERDAALSHVLAASPEGAAERLLSELGRAVGASVEPETEPYSTDVDATGPLWRCWG